MLRGIEASNGVANVMVSDPWLGEQQHASPTVLW
jgi:hypothetical protein